VALPATVETVWALRKGAIRRKKRMSQVARAGFCPMDGGGLQGSILFGLLATGPVKKPCHLTGWMVTVPDWIFPPAFRTTV
jgi:hypothetical protein